MISSAIFCTRPTREKMRSLMPRNKDGVRAKSVVESGAREKLLLLSLLFILLLSQGLRAQDHPVDPTWLYRYVPELAEAKSDLASQSCHYHPIFGEGDKDNRSLQTVARFGEVTLDAHRNWQTV